MKRVIFPSSIALLASVLVLVAMAQSSPQAPRESKSPPEDSTLSEQERYDANIRTIRRLRDPMLQAILVRMANRIQALQSRVEALEAITVREDRRQEDTGRAEVDRERFAPQALQAEMESLQRHLRYQKRDIAEMEQSLRQKRLEMERMQAQIRYLEHLMATAGQEQAELRESSDSDVVTEDQILEDLNQ